MLYRHFPKIANKEFSILTLALGGDPSTDSAREETLLRAAAERGINLVYAGSESESVRAAGALLEKTGLKETVFRIYEFRGKSGIELDAFMESAGRGSGDFLLIRIEDASDAERLGKEGVFAAASRALSSGAAGWCGFSVPPDSDAIRAAIAAFPRWTFWATDFNYLHYNITDAIREASACELSLVSLDPFAGGALELVNADAHKIFHDAPVPRSNDEWALRAVWEMQDVTTAVIKPASAEDLFRKTILAEAGRANSLPVRELAVLEAAAEKLTR